MGKEYSTYMAKKVNVDDTTSSALNDIMREWLNYQTKRYAFLKKHNQLGTYDKNKCDAYRKTQTFINQKNKTQELFDTRYARAIDIDIQARIESQIKVKELEIDNKEIVLEKKRKDLKFHHKKFRNSQQANYLLEDIQSRYHRYNGILKKVQRLEAKIDKLKKDIETQKVNIVFGGKTLWQKQFKKHVSYDDWVKQWKQRGDRFECGGSKSERMGNEQFQMTLNDDNKSYNLRINVPYCLRDTYGDTITIPNIYFKYGHHVIKENVQQHQAYQRAKQYYTNEVRRINKLENKSDKQKQHLLSALGQAPKADDFGVKSMSFLIIRKNNGFYIHVSLPNHIPKIQTSDKKGVIGIDINSDNISTATINRQGKLLESHVYRFNFGHKKSSAHREQMIFKHINTIIEDAKKKKKDIAIEKLNFTLKKSLAVKGGNKNYNRMIHSLAYQKIKERIRVLCKLNGIKLRPVNPAYTSFIGRVVYSKPYGISTHQSASYVIARRHYQLKEELLQKKLYFIYKDKTCRLEIPERIFKEQGKQISFQFLRKVYNWFEKELKAPSRFYSEPLRS